MQIHITSVTPNTMGGHTITIDTSGEKSVNTAKVLALGKDVSDALADGKISFFEAMRIVADLTGSVG